MKELIQNQTIFQVNMQLLSMILWGALPGNILFQLELKQKDYVK